MFQANGDSAFTKSLEYKLPLDFWLQGHFAMVVIRGLETADLSTAAPHPRRGWPNSGMWSLAMEILTSAGISQPRLSQEE